MGVLDGEGKKVNVMIPIGIVGSEEIKAQAVTLGAGIFEAVFNVFVSK